jgi:hypothetical protein
MRRYLVTAVVIALTSVCAQLAGTVANASAVGAGKHLYARFDNSQLASTAALSALRGMRVGSPAERGPGKRSLGTTSYNWSGYVDLKTSTNKKYSAISAQWTEPSVTCPSKEDQSAVFWVGLDGWNDSTVEQDGTFAQCYLGTAYYYTWWEMYPTNDIQTVGTISPGDSITSTVTYSGGTYTLSVTDSSTPSASFTEHETCASNLSCKRSSSEWIAEAPSGSRGLFPLADFGTWALSHATVTGTSGSGVIGTFSNEQIVMIDSGDDYNLATPSSLNGSGNGFTDTWGNSY